MTNEAELRRMILGKRIRHFRLKSGQTLDQLGERVGASASQISLFENGKREPKLSSLELIATALGVETSALLENEAPDRRSALEIELERAQQAPLYAGLALPPIKSIKSLSDDALESVVGLHRELLRRAKAAAATPEEARRANTAIRLKMLERNNYIGDIERIASDLMRRIGHTTGAVTHREVAIMAEMLGFTLIFADDLPPNTRSITDLENGRIYLPPASIPGGHGLRSLSLQAMAHRVLGHERPDSYAEFLEQRLQINYFASACLLPEERAVSFLQSAKRNRNLAVEDLRDAFGVTHETAAHRFTNLATEHLDLVTHFYRTDAAGALHRGYQNDATPFPVDHTGSIEGQPVCAKWAGRVAFDRKNRTTEYYQYTDTPAGTFWSSVQTGESEDGAFSISFGVPFDDAKWFRGRDTTVRTHSSCPDPKCCRTPSAELRDRWEGRAWPSARMHQHVLAPLPTGSFPGVDDTVMYAFLSKHAPEEI